MMPTPACRIAAIAAAMLVAGAALANDEARLRAEGIAVLRAATALAHDDGRESSACRIMGEWSKETVPRDIARRVFGSNLRADSMAGSRVPDSYTLLSAVEPDPARLCSPETIRHQREAAKAALPGETKFFYHVSCYTFPVFDAAFTKAAVVWTDLYSDELLGEADAKPGGIAFTVSALVFSKVGRTWHLVGTEVIGQT